MKLPTKNYRIGDLVQLTGEHSVLVEEDPGHLIDFFPRDTSKFVGIVVDIKRCIDHSEVTVMINSAYYYVPTWNGTIPSLILLNKK